MNLPGDPWRFYLELLIGALLMVIVVRTARKDGQLLPGWRSMQWLGIVTTGVIAAFAVSDPGIRLINSAAQRPVLSVALGIFAATNLYLVRRWNRVVFGGVEVAFALVTFAVIVREAASITGTVAVAFFGAVYVLIRGLTNIEEGWRSTGALGRGIGS